MESGKNYSFIHLVIHSLKNMNKTDIDPEGKQRETGIKQQIYNYNVCKGLMKQKMMLWLSDQGALFLDLRVKGSQQSHRTYIAGRRSVSCKPPIEKSLWV